MAGEFRWQAGRPATAQVGGWVLAHCQQRFLQDDNGLLFPREWLKRQELPLLAEHGVGHWQGEPVYVLELDEPIELPGMAWAPLRQFMLHGDFDQFCMLGYASQIGIWARHNRFCGNCGTRMQAQDHERVMQCPQCGLHRYPRLSPSMIVLVTRGDEVLLARSPRFVPGSTVPWPASSRPASRWSSAWSARCAKRSGWRSPISNTSAARTGRSRIR